MHVGHLRSSIIGDAIVRIFLFLGHKVIKQNHIGDWGTQFGFLIQYIIENNLTFTNISEVSKVYKEARALFDNNDEFAIRSKKRLILLQAGDGFTSSIWKNLSKIIYQHFNEIFSKLGLLLKEEDACGESFYNFMLPSIVEELLDKGIAEESDGAKVVFLPGFYDPDKNLVPMIIQKSDGGYLYHTTDLAAAKYRVEKLNADKIIYITDARQKQHFEMLFTALAKAGWVKNNFVILNHIAFGAILGEDKKPFKTRSGDTISLTVLLTEAEIKAKELIRNKYPLIDKTELDEIGNSIGIGALKYADLSNDLAKDYVFSWERMLSFNGNTAPYLQNAYVRIKSIFRKENINLDDLDKMKNHPIIITNEEEKKLCIKVNEFPDVIKSIEEKLAPNLLCNYLYDLASLFHNFYEVYPIGKCNDQEVKLSRLLISSLVADTLNLGLNLLGINVIERM
jgi:arginyl-tRNA synthetase